MADADLHSESADAMAKERHLDLANILHETEMNVEGLGTLCQALGCSDMYNNDMQMLFRSLTTLVSEITGQIGSAKAIVEAA